MKRLLLTTGGTGGHIYPALAVAERVRCKYPGCNILFVGGKDGPEGQAAAEAGLKFLGLPAKGVVGRGFKSLGSVLWLTRSLIQAWKLLGEFCPDVVIGFGGYAGFSSVLAASLKGIPTALHEQNSIPGMANRLLAKRVDKILVSMPYMPEGAFVQGHQVYTGNPVRESICVLRAHEHVQRRNVLILGGSQGASALNQHILQELDSLKKLGLHLWHQTGAAEFSAVAQVYKDKYPECRVDAFIDDMEAAYDFADLVVCRAGATTIAELCAAGKPAILIPFPYAAHDHQRKNALVLEEAGAALLVQQNCLADMGLASALGDLFAMPERLQAMGQAARGLGACDAADRVLEELEKLITAKG